MPLWLLKLFGDHAVTIVLLAALGGALGWGWYRGIEIKSLQADVATEKANVETLQAYARSLNDSVKAQNEAVAKMKDEADKRLATAQNALKAARQAAARHQDKAAAIIAKPQPAGDVCTLAKLASQDFDDELRNERVAK